MKSDLTDITVHVHMEREKAILVSVDGNRNGAVWLPLSAIECERRRTAPHIADIKLSEQLAIEKGLV